MWITNRMIFHIWSVLFVEYAKQIPILVSSILQVLSTSKLQVEFISIIEAMEFPNENTWSNDNKHVRILN